MPWAYRPLQLHALARRLRSFKTLSCRQFRVGGMTKNACADEVVEAQDHNSCNPYHTSILVCLSSTSASQILATNGVTSTYPKSRNWANRMTNRASCCHAPIYEATIEILGRRFDCGASDEPGNLMFTSVRIPSPGRRHLFNDVQALDARDDDVTGTGCVFKKQTQKSIPPRRQYWNKSYSHALS
ncbi:hypothetical protein BDY19DRAFT_542826 [Irpex rosettiformis]|uniref:Uncharacterized protein n=1 Tax=Irpex rosettiformis TaxID=378272 RepID=A0ACB8TQW8_9APHY|nr:hypothetical protein BDY19DRAFT_542826 [Irpex rosettiformis]